MVAGPRHPPHAVATPVTGTEIYLDRLIGAVGGAVIAVAIVPPGTWFPLRRTIVSLASGFMLEPILRRYLGWLSEADTIIASACIVSTCSWWIWHAVIKALDAWNITIPWLSRKKPG